MTTSFQPVLGDKNDVKLDEMLRQIVERMEDLQEILQKADATLKTNEVEDAPIVEEVELKVQFMQHAEGNQKHGIYDSEQMSAELQRGNPHTENPDE